MPRASLPGRGQISLLGCRTRHAHVPNTPVPCTLCPTGAPCVCHATEPRIATEPFQAEQKEQDEHRGECASGLKSTDLHPRTWGLQEQEQQTKHLQ